MNRVAALHIQVETARAIVQEQGGDFVLCLKGNQPGLHRQAEIFLPASVPPRQVEIQDSRGCRERRAIMRRAVDPAPMNFPHIAQLARLERTRDLRDP